MHNCDYSLIRMYQIHDGHPFCYTHETCACECPREHVAWGEYVGIGVFILFGIGIIWLIGQFGF